MTAPQPIELVEYDPAWPQQFLNLRDVLKSKLQDIALAIEHVGSTSVPGLAAKPILDIDIVIATRDHLPPVIEGLRALGYETRGDQGMPGREAFRRDAPDVPRNGSGREWPAHHLYVCSAENRELRRHIAFRDYLRVHPEQAAAYAALKHRLALQYREDRLGYNEAKTAFVEAILEQADGEASCVSHSWI